MCFVLFYELIIFLISSFIIKILDPFTCFILVCVYNDLFFIILRVNYFFLVCFSVFCCSVSRFKKENQIIYFIFECGEVLFIYLFCLNQSFLIAVFSRNVYSYFLFCLFLSFMTLYYMFWHLWRVADNSWLLTLYLLTNTINLSPSPASLFPNVFHIYIMRKPCQKKLLMGCWR